MTMSKIEVTLYKAGTQIEAGGNWFDRIVKPAPEALELVKKGEWHDHPTKAHYASLSAEDKAKHDEPAGMGRLTTSTQFTHDQIEALAKKDEKKPTPPQTQTNAPKADDNGTGTGTDNNGQINGAAPASKGTIAAPKAKAPAKAKGAKKAAPQKPEEKTLATDKEEKPEDVKKNDDQSGTDKDHDNGDGSKD
ncbi:hypothetical protein [Kosakonia phage Kc259]|nr:hypothetical protein [Kosakonia phage Kc259]